MKLRKSVLRLAASAVILMFAVSAAKAAPRDETLLVVREQGPNSMDIMGMGTNRPAYGLSWNVYDRLLTYGKMTDASGALKYDFQQMAPELAESWEVSPDGTRIVFHLRKNAVFHDGTPVTAEDVKWSFDRAVSVGGFPTFQMNAGSMTRSEQFAVIDAHTFQVTLPRKDKLSLPDIGTPVPAIINSRLARKHATEKDPWAMEWLKNNDAGGGAYTVREFKPGVQTVYERFEQWKSGEKPAIKTVVERVVPSASTRRAMLEKGDVDISFDLSPKDAAALLENKKIRVEGMPIENCMWFVDMNVTKPPFDNLKVRQAISYAVPYEEIFKASAYGRGFALFGATSARPATARWIQPYAFATDIAKARELLAEAGFPNGFTTTLSFNLGTATWGEPAALLLQENLKKIGVETRIEKIPAANWRSEMAKKNMPLLVDNMGGWLNYADYFFFWNYHSQNGVFNTMSYQNREMDAYIESARFAENKKSYDKSIIDCIAKAVADAPRLPLYQPSLDAAMQPGVDGYVYWFHRQIDYRSIRKK
ncbi:MAG: ABC transporter substrate-binding protein [Desulfovibrio sp.]|jgi:peptide/nickel transport system substrate-binding protein|nr:ABC transporter substrate-binding protein [Desulfovibrio sp.]